MTTKKRKADFIEIKVRALVEVRLHADGTQEIVRVITNTDPPSLTRHLYPDELEPGQDEWDGGGVAILDPKHAPNGRALVNKACKATDQIEAAICSAVYD